jgi:hypothetical protein
MFELKIIGINGQNDPTVFFKNQWSPRKIMHPRCILPKSMPHPCLGAVQGGWRAIFRRSTRSDIISFPYGIEKTKRFGKRLFSFLMLYIVQNCRLLNYQS